MSIRDDSTTFPPPPQSRSMTISGNCTQTSCRVCQLPARMTSCSSRRDFCQDDLSIHRDDSTHFECIGHECRSIRSLLVSESLGGSKKGTPMTQILLRYTAHCNNFIFIFVLYKNINANACSNITSGRIGFNAQKYS